MNAFARWLLPPTILALALALGAWWRSESGMDFRSPLAPFAPDAARAVTIEGKGLRARFERRGDAWRQVEPFEQVADAGAVRALLVAAADAAPVYRVPLGSAPVESRLSAPDLTVSVALADGGTRAWSVGADHPAGLAWIGERGADAAGPCLPELRRLAVAASRGGLRDDRLFERAGVDSERIRIALQAGASVDEVLLERTPEGWRLRQPFASRADAAAVNAFLQAAAKLRHAGVVQEVGGDGAVHGLAQPAAEISVRTLNVATGQRDDEIVQVGAENGSGGRFVRQSGRPPVLSIDAKGVAALLPPVAGFVDPRACGLRPDEVVQLRVLDLDGHARVHLRRQASGWVRVDGSGASQSIDDRNARELVRSLCEARANTVAGDEPRAEWLMGRVELSAASGEPKTVSLWRLPDGRWAMTDGDGPARVHPASLPMPLAPDDHPPKR